MYFLINHNRKIIWGWSAKSGCRSLKRYFYRLGSSEHYTDKTTKEIISQIKNPCEKALFSCLCKFLGEKRTGALFHGQKILEREYFIGSYYLVMLVIMLARKIIAPLFNHTISQLENCINSVNDFDVHRDSYNCLNFEHKYYTKILFIRDPYKRIVSGFLDKYVAGVYSLDIKNLTFEKFVDELDNNKLENINRHHFTPQLSEAHESSIQFDKIYDIENIDYDYIKKLFGKNIDIGDYIKTLYDDSFEGKAYGITLKELRKMQSKPPYGSFYNKKIKKKVYSFYKKDFLFFEKYGFNYDVVTDNAETYTPPPRIVEGNILFPRAGVRLCTLGRLENRVIGGGANESRFGPSVRRIHPAPPPLNTIAPPSLAIILAAKEINPPPRHSRRQAGNQRQRQ